MEYRIYKRLSSKTAPLLLDKYNLNQTDSGVFQENEIRLLLGLLLNTAGKQRYAIAETDIVLEQNKDNFNSYMAHNLSATVMYEKGWKKIAAKEEIKASDFIGNSYRVDSGGRTFIISEFILAKKSTHSLEFE